jgi:hypothetical protein
MRSGGGRRRAYRCTRVSCGTRDAVQRSLLTAALLYTLYASHSRTAVVFPYPINLLGTEAAALVFLALLDVGRMVLGHKGNLTQSRLPLLLFLLLSVPVIVGHIYFLIAQTYVMRLDQIINAIALVSRERDMRERSDTRGEAFPSHNAQQRCACAMNAAQCVLAVALFSPRLAYCVSCSSPYRVPSLLPILFFSQVFVCLEFLFGFFIVIAVLSMRAM